MTKFVTRIAPSPTGMFHMGTARTAIFNWLAAKASGGTMILRIDDTDENRNDVEAVRVIHDAMAWLGLDYGTTFNQSDKKETYAGIADTLVEAGMAYRDPNDAKDGSDAVPIRLKGTSDIIPKEWHDTIKGTIVVSDKDREAIDGLVLVRSDGSPTYHFASVVDDVGCGVNYVIRGTDHISNTPKQLAIINLLDKMGMQCDEYPSTPSYAHVGLIDVKTADGKRKKLSKRDDGASLLTFKDNGIHPDAMFNYLLRLGWSPSDPNFDKHTPYISKDMAVELFLTAGKMRNSPVLFDNDKLNWYNKHYTK